MHAILFSLVLSGLNVTNGRPVPRLDDADGSTVLLGNSQYSCSGTFLSETVLLTAAHCVRSRSVTIQAFEPVTSERVVFHREFFDLELSGSSLEARAPYDVALAIFPAGTATHFGVKRFRKIAASRPARGDSVRLLGFGANDAEKLSGVGEKRDGVNVILDFDDDRLVIEGASGPGTASGADANIAPGDSGGPLLDARGDIVGVAEAVSAVRGGRHYGFFISTLSARSLKLLQRAAPELVPAGVPLPPPDPVPALPPSEASEHGVCGFDFTFQQHIENGNYTTDVCWAVDPVSRCAPGYVCPPARSAPMACPAQDHVRELACEPAP